MLFGAHDVRDTHLDVVHHIGEQEHRRAVTPQQHEVLDRRVLEVHLAAHTIDDRRRAVGHTEAQHPAGGRFETAVAGVPVVARLSGRLRPGLDLVGRQVAVVRGALVEQPVRRRHVGSRMVALEVGSLEAIIVGRDADPGERIDDPLRPLGAVPGLVGVLDPEHERAAALAGEGPVVQRRARPADMERAGRRRGETVAR